MTDLAKISEELDNVRTAIALAGKFVAKLAEDPTWSINHGAHIQMRLTPHADQASSGVLNKALADRLKARAVEELTGAAADLRVEERRLCQELIQAAAKTAAGGL